MESMEWSGVGVGMELQILNFSETNINDKTFTKVFSVP